jgi:hypothetical protein
LVDGSVILVFVSALIAFGALNKLFYLVRFKPDLTIVPIFSSIKEVFKKMIFY